MSFNQQVKRFKASKPLTTLLTLDKHLKFTRDIARTNRNDEKDNRRLPNHSIIDQLRQLFEPNIVFIFYQQILESHKLEEIPECKGPGKFYFSPNEKKKYNKTYEYHVYQQDGALMFNCMYSTSMELPCPHFIRYCSDMSIPINLTFCKHWLNPELQECFIKISKEQVCELFVLEKQIHQNKLQRIADAKFWDEKKKKTKMRESKWFFFFMFFNCMWFCLFVFHCVSFC